MILHPRAATDVAENYDGGSSSLLLHRDLFLPPKLVGSIKNQQILAKSEDWGFSKGEFWETLFVGFSGLRYGRIHFG